MLITITDIKHNQQRYPTVGDWVWDANGNLLITISDMGDWRYNFLIAFHELIEVMLCRKRGITQEEVDQFDMVYEKQRKENDFSEPGDSRLAPYYNEHQFATKMEREMARELGVDWDDYNEKVLSL
jgi:hypothetical protein